MLDFCFESKPLPVSPAVAATSHDRAVVIWVHGVAFQTYGLLSAYPLAKCGMPSL